MHARWRPNRYITRHAHTHTTCIHIYTNWKPYRNLNDCVCLSVHREPCLILFYAMKIGIKIRIKHLQNSVDTIMPLHIATKHSFCIYTSMYTFMCLVECLFRQLH